MNITDKDILESSTSIINTLITQGRAQKEDVVPLLGSLFKELRSAANIEHHEEQKPAVPIKKSITPDYLICLEDGKKFKSLKRHLKSHYGLSPEEYREKWSLPHDYPMVAPNYAAARSRLAKKMGLGLRGSQNECGVPAPIKKANGNNRLNGSSNRRAHSDANPAPS